MENNNFNGNNSGNTVKKNEGGFNGIRNIDAPERSYKRENKFKEIKLERNNSSFWKKIILSIFILGIIAGLISYFFHSTTFEIRNNYKDISFSNDIMKASVVKDDENKTLPFKILTFNFELEKGVESKMVEDVKEKATGKIKIINDTSKVQKLRKETRFEVDGKIFKTYKSVTIPAKTSVVKEAFADVAGEEYNLKKGLKMTVPGFKEINDTNLFKNITGEIAESFEGGLVGKKDIPDKTDLEEKKKVLAEEVEPKTLVKVRQKLPEGSILNTDGVFKEVKYSTKMVGDVLNAVAGVKVKAIIFDEKEFLSAASGLDKEEMEKYDITSTAFLKFKIIDREKISIDSLKDFTFELNGNIKYSKEFDGDEFKNLVKGKSEAEYNILKEKNYKELLIDVSTTPFWMSSIADKVEDISVEMEKN